MNTKSDCLSRFTWVNSEFVQTLIEKSEGNEHVSLKTFSIAKALLGGENFSSSMVRLEVKFDDAQREKSKVFLIKIAIDSDEFAGVCEESHIFEKEIETYTKILPEVESLLRSIDHSGQLAPKCYLSDVKRRMLVFEDLSQQQFQNVDKAQGFDVTYMKVVLSTLAKWHATTSILLLKKPEIFEEHSKKEWYKDDVVVKKFFEGIAKTVSDAARNWKGFERIAEKLITVPQHIYDNIYKAYLPRDNEFNTLAHGDMWSNNIMFQQDQNGKPVGIRFVDFALGKHTSPSIDLVCLLYGCSHDSVRQSDRENLIQFYHTELIELLKRLEYPKELPTLFEIQLASFRADWYNILIVLLVIGVRYVSESGAFMDLVDAETFTQMFSHPDCVAKMKYTLKLFDRRGYFDF